MSVLGTSGPIPSPHGPSQANALLQVEDLVIRYSTARGPVEAVAGISFNIESGEVLGLVGESGSGKTSLALSLLKVLPDNASIPRGHIYFNGSDLAPMSEREMRGYRWKHISMIFQAAMNSLDPMYRVGDQIAEAILAHERLSARGLKDRVSRLCSTVGLDESVMGQYPHQYSGGMRQRAAIAMALGCNPEIVIADEPTTALDVIIQHRILVELKRLQVQRGTAMLYISHDLGVIATLSDRVAVMYAGKIVETAQTNALFQRCFHPYSAALIAALPSVRGPRRVLKSLAAEPPDLVDLQVGCRFAPRCPLATDICHEQEPPLVEQDSSHFAACWHPEQASGVFSDG